MVSFPELVLASRRRVVVAEEEWGSVQQMCPGPGHPKPVMSCVCVLRPVFAFCVLRYVRRQNARRSPKCLEMLGTGRENAIGRG